MPAESVERSFRCVLLLVVICDCPSLPPPGKKTKEEAEKAEVEQEALTKITTALEAGVCVPLTLVTASVSSLRTPPVAVGSNQWQHST